jgi:hypothetical protein
MIGGFFVFPCQAARGLPDRNEKINNRPSRANKMKDRREQWAKKNQRRHSFRRFRPARRMGEDIMKQIRMAHVKTVRSAASIKAISGSISAQSDTKWAPAHTNPPTLAAFFLAWRTRQQTAVQSPVSLPPGMRLINATATFSRPDERSRSKNCRHFVCVGQVTSRSAQPDAISDRRVRNKKKMKKSINNV